MKKEFLIFVLVLSNLVNIAQDYQNHLEKYWYYRQRLKDEFMLQFDNSLVQGSNQVAENIHLYDPDDQFMRWADGLWWHGQYIGVLAIEYRLLKDNGQDYSETLSELNLALNSYDRLDIAAGDCFPDGYDLWDGFYIRDDQIYNDEFTSTFPDIEIKNDYSKCPYGENKVFTSQDGNIQMFLGLLLAKTLVDNYWVQDKVSWIASGIINRMHHPDDLGIERWEILNYFYHPAVPVQGGFWSELLFYKWGHATAASRITGENEHTGTSSNFIAREKWNLNQNLILNHYATKDNHIINNKSKGSFKQNGDNPDNIWAPYAGYMTATLSMLADEPGAGVDNVYDWLVIFYNDTKGYLTMPDDLGLYPHLPLISEIVNGYYGNDRLDGSLFEDEFFDTAPDCGAYNYYVGDENIVSASPWHTMSLACPQHNSVPNNSHDHRGEYNMLDYMLLYSSYFQNYHSNEGYIPYIFTSRCYPMTIVMSHIGLPSSNTKPLKKVLDADEIYAARQIDAMNCISFDGNVHYKAGQRIRFLPGFHADAGSKVKAQIDIDMNDEVYFVKTNVNTCTRADASPTKIRIDKQGLTNMSQENLMSDVDADTPSVDRKTANQINNTKVSVYPNPSKGIFTVNVETELEVELFEVYVFDTYGRSINVGKSIDYLVFKVNLYDYDKGVYFLIINLDGEVFSRKLVLL